MSTNVPLRILEGSAPAPPDGPRADQARTDPTTGGGGDRRGLVRRSRHPVCFDGRRYRLEYAEAGEPPGEDEDGSIVSPERDGPGWFRLVPTSHDVTPSSSSWA